MSDDLVAFLRARLDEDEAEANPRTCGCLDADHVPSCVPTPWLERPRREVAAKRALLAGHEGVHRCDWGEHRGGTFEPCKQVAILAAIYSDHPDFEPEWKP